MTCTQACFMRRFNGVLIWFNSHFFKKYHTIIDINIGYIYIYIYNNNYGENPAIPWFIPQFWTKPGWKPADSLNDFVESPQEVNPPILVIICNNIMYPKKRTVITITCYLYNKMWVMFDFACKWISGSWCVKGNCSCWNELWVKIVEQILLHFIGW